MNQEKLSQYGVEMYSNSLLFFIELNKRPAIVKIAIKFLIGKNGWNHLLALKDECKKLYKDVPDAEYEFVIPKNLF